MSAAQALQPLTGPVLIGTALGTFLSGVTLTQCYTYFSTFKTDRAAYRWAVIGMLILDITHTVTCQALLWLWFITHYGDASIPPVTPWFSALDPVMCGIAAFVVQIFYAHRIYLLSQGSLVIPCLVAFGSLFQLAWSAGVTAEAFIIKYFVNFRSWTYGIACWLGMAAATDILITAGLIWLLSRSKSSLRHTKSMTDRLIALTIETNGLTFAVTLLDLVLFVSRRDASHIATNLCLIKLYFNSFLVSLNSRTHLSHKLGDSRSIHSTISKPHQDANHSLTLPVYELTNGQSIKVEDLQIPDGIHVHTTASLSAGHVSEPLIFKSFSSQSKPNDIGSFRADKNNGFTTDISGGVHAYQ